MNYAFYTFFVLDTECKLTEERSYVLYSSLGSFYIPLAIIIFVYIKIWQNMRNRIRKRAEGSGLNALKKPTYANEQSAGEETTKGIPFTSKCKLTSISLFCRRGNDSTSSNCDDTKQHKIDRNTKEDAVKEIKQTDIPLINFHNSNNIAQEQEENENENRRKSISEVNIHFV